MQTQFKDNADKFADLQGKVNTMKNLVDTNINKMQQVEATLAEQVDIQHNLNDKVSQGIEKMGKMVGIVDRRLDQIESRFVSLTEHVGRSDTMSHQIKDF